ncbi:multidrug effflux MFS transporter [Xanthobacter autotrophicus]|uniref:multidrug effflux MFS transporter n=1 Tax=Xanthobacter autotrophicus TaxID=280 RepID=UPI00372CAD21
MSHPERAPAPRNASIPAKATAPTRPPFLEFVALIALLIGMTAFSIDNLLPAFGAIREDFSLTNANDVQVMVYAYLLGIGAAQFLYGPISDVVGRRPILFAGLAIYAVGTLLALFTRDFNVLIAARVIQGVGAASGRVLAIAIVRDRFEGREMARIMSLAMMVFLTVPILAPALGSLILAFGSWHLIFIAMLALAVALLVWFGLRMPETLHPQYRIPFSFRAIGKAVVLTLTTRRAAGYAVAIGLMMGSLMAYVGSASQVFQTDVYKLGNLFPVAFAAVAGIMAVASFTNAALVRRIGMRRLSHGGICGFIAVGAVMVAASLAYGGKPPLLLFCGLIGAGQFLFALTVPNFNSMAMEPLGAVAGTASSFIGGFTTLMASVLGYFVGRAFDGTVLPLSLGYLVLGAIALVFVLWAEKGRLFGHNP